MGPLPRPALAAIFRDPDRVLGGEGGIRVAAQHGPSCGLWRPRASARAATRRAPSCAPQHGPSCGLWRPRASARAAVGSNPTFARTATGSPWSDIAGSSSRSWRRGWDSNPRTACTVNGFRDRPIRPLWHLSKLAERVGFEPTVGGYPTRALQARSFDHSDTSPLYLASASHQTSAAISRDVAGEQRRPLLQRTWRRERRAEKNPASSLLQASSSTPQVTSRR